MVWGDSDGGFVDLANRRFESIEKRVQKEVYKMVAVATTAVASMIVAKAAVIALMVF